MSLKIYIRKPIVMAILSLLLCINLYGVSGITVQIIRCGIICLNFWIVLSTFSKSRGILNFEIWIYGIVIVLSAFVNRNTTNELLSGILYALMIVSTYIVYYSAMNKYGEDTVIKNICRVVAIVVLIVGLNVIVTQGAGSGNINHVHKSFYIGSKFTVSYFNMFAFALILGRIKRFKLLIPIILAMFFIYIDVLMDCMTGVAGILAIIIIYYFKRYFEFFLIQPKTVIIAIILSGAFAIFMESVTSLGLVKWFVLDILNSDLDMTGRAGIFALLSQVVLSKPILGYGYANTVIFDILGYGNPQNGIFDILVSYGIVGAAAFINILRVTFKSNKDVVELSDEKYMILAFIYAMILCGTVEINFSLLFLIATIMYKNKI